MEDNLASFLIKKNERFLKGHNYYLNKVKRIPVDVFDLTELYNIYVNVFESKISKMAIQHRMIGFQTLIESVIANVNYSFLSSLEMLKEAEGDINLLNVIYKNPDDALANDYFNDYLNMSIDTTYDLDDRFGEAVYDMFKSIGQMYYEDLDKELFLREFENIQEILTAYFLSNRINGISIIIPTKWEFNTMDINTLPKDKLFKLGEKFLYRKSVRLYCNRYNLLDIGNESVASEIFWPYNDLTMMAYNKIAGESRLLDDNFVMENYYAE